MLKAGFILLTIALAITLFACASLVAGKAFTRVSEEKRFKVKIALVLFAWLLYVSLLSLRGVFTAVTFPPRIPLLLVLPAFVSFIFFFTNTKLKKIIDATPASLPVYVQSFRVVVELLIFASSMQGLLPKAATFEGYNYDIVIGVTAPLVAFFIAGKGNGNRFFMLVWNVAGLATLSVVVFILLSHAYFPAAWGTQGSILDKGLGVFPFTFLAGFLMPVAVFLHVFSIVKTLRTN
jgi:hypothetical protein